MARRDTFVRFLVKEDGLPQNTDCPSAGDFMNSFSTTQRGHAARTLTYAVLFAGLILPSRYVAAEGALAVGVPPNVVKDGFAYGLHHKESFVRGGAEHGAGDLSQTHRQPE
jgi:hypothetical protein